MYKYVQICSRTIGINHRVEGRLRELNVDTDDKILRCQKSLQHQMEYISKLVLQKSTATIHSGGGEKFSPQAPPSPSLVTGEKLRLDKSSFYAATRGPSEDMNGPFVNPFERDENAHPSRSGGQEHFYASATEKISADSSRRHHAERSQQAAGESFRRDILVNGNSSFGSRQEPLAMAGANSSGHLLRPQQTGDDFRASHKLPSPRQPSPRQEGPGAGGGGGSGLLAKASRNTAERFNFAAPFAAGTGSASDRQAGMNNHPSPTGGTHNNAPQSGGASSGTIAVKSHTRSSDSGPERKPDNNTSAYYTTANFSPTVPGPGVNGGWDGFLSSKVGQSASSRFAM